MTVNGRGWTPGAVVTVEYRLQFGNATGSSVDVFADERGKLSAGAKSSHGNNPPHLICLR